MDLLHLRGTMFPSGVFKRAVSSTGLELKPEIRLFLCKWLLTIFPSSIKLNESQLDSRERSSTVNLSSRTISGQRMEGTRLLVIYGEGTASFEFSQTRFLSVLDQHTRVGRRRLRRPQKTPRNLISIVFFPGKSPDIIWFLLLPSVFIRVGDLQAIRHLPADLI